MGLLALNRADHLEKIKSESFDLVIIGGGITGAGIALDAASRGLKVGLVEKNDFASGTSNKSTKLIHGGLRYLKQLEIGLVRETGTERAIVHRLAPHLVIPEKMLLPLIKDGTYGKFMTSIGLKVYDFLADVKEDDRRRMLDKAETLKKEPLLNGNIVLGSGLYAEFRTDDARLTIEILKKAATYGATIVNYCEVESFNYSAENSKIETLNCIDHESQSPFKISAQQFVSAAGPWVDTLRKKDNSLKNKHLHLTKGVHIVFPFEKLPLKQSIYFDVSDGRMVFAIPRGRTTYVGTTDTNYYGSLNRVVAMKADAQYLLNAVNSMFPAVQLNMDDIESNWAGLRPLIHEENKAASELSRKDEIFISKSGLISIAGGKLTGYRKMAQRVVDTAIKYGFKNIENKFGKSNTHKIELVEPAFKNGDEVTVYKKKLCVILDEIGITDKFWAWYLTTTYGKQATIILDKSNNFNCEDRLEAIIRAELWFCINYEMVCSLSDFFVRRTGRLYFDLPSVKKYMDVILGDCVTLLKWTKDRAAAEKASMNLLIRDATTYYLEEFK